MAYATVTVAAPGAIDNVTVNVSEVVPLLPSATAASPIDNVGNDAMSSLVIVPVALPSEIVAPEGEARTTRKVSACSTSVSPTTDTLMVCAVVVPLNVKVPFVAV